MEFRNRDGSGVVRLKHLIEDTDRHGNVRVYFRRRGRKVRLHETVGTDEFMAEYKAAYVDAAPKPKTRSAQPAAGSLHWLIGEYYQSGEFEQLAESTRTVRRGILEHIRKKHGAFPATLVDASHVLDIRDAKKELPESANGRVKALRQVFKWAVGKKHMQYNPAREVPYLRPKNKHGFHTWTPAEVEKFEERHPIGSKARLALALLLYTGVRRSDVVRLGPQMERDGWLNFTITKGGEDHAIPILPVLQDVIDASPSGHLAYLVTAFGKPYTPAGFGNWFRRRCDEALLTQCSAHGLRKSGATILAENGATEHELMAVYGWDSPKQAALYTRKANRKKLAGAVMGKLNGNGSVPLSGVVPSGGTKRGKKS